MSWIWREHSLKRNVWMPRNRLIWAVEKSSDVLPWDVGVHDIPAADQGLAALIGPPTSKGRSLVVLFPQTAQTLAIRVE